MKDVRDRRDDDDRENGTNGDDRKGMTESCQLVSQVADVILVTMDSPIPAHDELDTAE